MVGGNMPNEKEVFSNQIDHANKVVAKPMPAKINDIDVNGDFYDGLIDATQESKLDLSIINSFTNISRSRDQVYNLLDTMGEDPIIASALQIYASDCCEPNDDGRVVWCESDNQEVFGCVENILDNLNIDKIAFGHIYSLCKYGDLYLRLYRNEEFNSLANKFNNLLARKERNRNGLLKEEIELSEEEKHLNEGVIINAFAKDDHYAQYMEAVKNPAEVFNLYKFGKSYGYLKTNVPHQERNQDDLLEPYKRNRFMYQFRQDDTDVDIFSATEFVHACLEDNSDRTEEEVSLINGDEEANDKTFTFAVKRGQSILYNSFEIWRELKLLENSVLLNRLTQSSVVRAVNVEVGDMDKDAVKALLGRIKQMIEQKSAISVNKSMQEYTNPGPVQNTIYVPMHEGIGNVQINSIGGDVKVGDLSDLNYWKNKLYASLAIPGGYLGEGDAEGSLFNNGNSLSLKSSRYAKTVKRIQNAYCQAITDSINLILLDRGLYDYINRFTIKMQAPATQEEKDRKESMSSTLSNIDSVMRLLEMIQDPTGKLRALKSMLSNAVSDQEVVAVIEDEIARLEEGVALTTGDGEDSDLGGGSDLDLGGGSDAGDLPSPEDILDNADDNAEAAAEAEAEGGANESLGGSGDLPSFSDMGMSYTDVR